MSTAEKTITAKPSAEESVPTLERGDTLTCDEFLRRWEVMARVKRAELLGGIVYMPSPLSWEHGRAHSHLSAWLAVYSASTPGCEPADDATCLMSADDAPQPDTALRILPEYGGQAPLAGRFVKGAPELIAEVCLSSTSYDLHQKRAVYEKAGVREYVAVLLREKELRWHRLVGEAFQQVEPDAAGVFHSEVFPGLWLDGAALLSGQLAPVLAMLSAGLATPEHAAFVAHLAARRTS